MEKETRLHEIRIKEIPGQLKKSRREFIAATVLAGAGISSSQALWANCWDYHDGNSEVRMGKALREGYREKVFLMSKFDGRTRDSATQIEESLKRLETDLIGLMQVHEIIRLEDPDRCIAPGG